MHIDATSESDKNNLASLKSALPSVLQVVLCDAEHVNSMIHLTNFARPFRLLPTPTNRRLLLQFIASALEFSTELKRTPALVEAMRPAEPTVAYSSPIVTRLRGLVSSIKERLSFAWR